MYKDKFGNNYLKIALHLHTTITDGQKTPEEVAEIYKNAGFDAIALTDHWYYGKEQTLHGLPILSGCEYNLGGSDTSVDVMHIIGVMMEEDPQIQRSSATRQEVIDKINKAGGLAIFGHPAWSLNTLDDAKSLNGFGGVEIFNSVSECGQNVNRAYSDYFVDMCANSGIYYKILATDDAHAYDGNDELRGFIYVKGNEIDREKILDAIKRGDFCASQGPIISAEIKDGYLIIDCTETCSICVCSNAAWLPERVLKGENLTHFEYKIRPIEKWVRAEATDKNGKKAWSNIFIPEK
ncbi:MAG: hypothetical protein E7564_05500 [Ruminococcaceae bacterium]|nr:hypothetical protein [Oscillospiraceae bacterium]